jgi:hypothetical protein
MGMQTGGVGASLSLPARITSLKLPATGDQQQQQQQQSLTVIAAYHGADPSLILTGLRRGMSLINTLLKQQETSKQL